MYAVVKSGGKQHKVSVGETVSVELLDAEPGAVVLLPALLVNDGEHILTGTDAEAATVSATVLGHGKADKVIVFKFKKRKGYKVTRGHRQQLTLLEVTEIAAGGKKSTAAASTKVAAPKAEKKPAAAKAEAKLTAEKPATKAAAAEKPAAKATTAVKKPAAAKTAAKKPAAKKSDAPAAKKPAAKKPATKKTDKPGE